MKKGHFDSKTGGNGFPKTESESWGLPLMNGGLKTHIFMIWSKPTLGILYLEEPGRILGGVEGTLKSKGSKKENMGGSISWAAEHHHS